MASKIDKELERRRKIREGDFEDKIAHLKNQWKIVRYSPLTYAIILIIILYGMYCDWNYKIMIDKAFSYILTVILTGLIQHIVIKGRKDKN